MIKPLTSLRFFFALMVFCCHLSFVSGDYEIFGQVYKYIFREGSLGVSFFFILSGFILSYNYKNKIIQKAISTKEFWVARFARIYPLHVFTLIIAIPLSLGIFTGKNTDLTIPWVEALLSNFFLIHAFIPLPHFHFSFNSPSWSISDEMFFYLMFPFIISLYARYKKAMKISLLLLLIVPLGIVIIKDPDLENALFYIHPLFRISDFMIGIILFELFERKTLVNFFSSRSRATLLELSAIGLFIVFFAFHRFIPHGYRYSCYYWLPMSAIVFVFSYSSGAFSAFLSNKFLVFLGEISFSFYLLHLLFIRYFQIINHHFSMVHNDLLLVAMILIASLIASCMTYWVIEKPCNKFIRGKFGDMGVATKAQKHEVL